MFCPPDGIAHLAENTESELALANKKVNTCGLLFDQAGSLRIVDHIRDRTITDVLDRFVNHMKRNE